MDALLGDLGRLRLADELGRGEGCPTCCQQIVYEDHAVPVLEDVHLGDSHGTGEVGMRGQMPVLAVDRDERLGADQVEEGEQFFPGGMSGHTD